MKDVKAAAKELFRVYKDQGASKVYMANCCDRFYVGLQPPTHCRTCTKTPVSHEVSSDEDIDNLDLTS